jgi:hypothetical protein
MEPDMNAPPRRSPLGCLGAFLGLAALVVLAGLAIAWGVERYVTSRLAPDPTSIARASLVGLREQNRLSAFAARFVAVVTTRQSMLGLTDEKTLILPGLVRYEVDLGKLEQRDVAWDAATKTLAVTLPPVEADQPQVDLAAIREYGSGGVLSRFTGADKTLDQVNRARAQAELAAQAREPVPMKLARDATRRAVERSFAMPLRAAGLDAQVGVRFADEPVPSRERWDVSRSVDDVLHDRP